MPFEVLTLVIFAGSFGAGLFGALLGLGGGVIIVPFLTLGLGIPIQAAAGASIVSVIATSSGAAAAYVRDRLTNIRIGMFLELATTTGALAGAFLAGIVSVKSLYILFALIMLYSAWSMFRKRKSELPDVKEGDPLAEKLKLNADYYDPKLGATVHYKVDGVLAGFGLMGFAGLIAGLLGIGNGAFKVLAMDSAMKLPMKVSTATSNFMIGVTAAGSASIYFARGDIQPEIAAPVALGVLAGAVAGTRVMSRVKSSTLRLIFVPVVIWISAQMLLKGVSM
ncbi:MAG TPA: sulfite exporter TauE/SafE family protein [Symbiobacteriaceae bacterium]|nr:sulfite exporter TauE/SafE family protein [Symbiobacteriaceae bacterium]